MDEMFDEPFPFEVPFWFLENDDREVFLKMDLEEGIVAAPIFTDEDLCIRYRNFLGDIGTPFHPRELPYPLFMISLFDFYDTNGITHVTFDPRNTIANTYSVQQMREHFNRLLDQ
jgi:hypothetical protein